MNIVELAPRMSPACVRVSLGKGEGCRIGNLSQQSRGFDSLPAKASQPAGSQSCMGRGDSAREA
jgi:hypothetical protein